jgi:hypothetical protein
MSFGRTVAALVILGAALTGGACDRRPVPAAASPAPTTAEDAAALARALSGRMGAPAGGHRVRRDARGRQFIDLAGRLPNATVVGTAPDGSMRLGCVSSPAQAEALLRGTSTPAGGR